MSSQLTHLPYNSDYKADNKADKDLSNITDTAKSMISGLGYPSSRNVELALGTSGTAFTAPANGKFYVYGNAAGTNNIFTFHNRTAGYSRRTMTPTKGNAMFCDIDARKGDEVSAVYQSFNKLTFAFFYAEGSKND